MEFTPPESLFGFAVVPFIIALVAMVKTIWVGFNAKFAPLVAMGLGIVISAGYALATHEVDVIVAVVWGIVYGLSAVGAYSAQKNVREGL